MTTVVTTIAALNALPLRTILAHPTMGPIETGEQGDGYRYVLMTGSAIGAEYLSEEFDFPMTVISRPDLPSQEDLWDQLQAIEPEPTPEP